MKLIKFIKAHRGCLIILMVFLSIAWMSGKAADDDKKYWKLERQRCINGVYEPCSLHCRSFWGVVLKSDNCD